MQNHDRRLTALEAAARPGATFTRITSDMTLLEASRAWAETVRNSQPQQLPAVAPADAGALAAAYAASLEDSHAQ